MRFSLRFLFALSLLSLSLCLSLLPSPISSHTHPITPLHPFESPLPTEQKDIDKLKNSILHFYSTVLKDRPAELKVFHAKSHACVNGVFHPSLSTIPKDLQVGIWSSPSLSSLPSSGIPAIVRFSNGFGSTEHKDPRQNSDLMPDARGMAIKLFWPHFLENHQKMCDVTPATCKDNTVDLIGFSAKHFTADKVSMISEGLVASFTNNIGHFLLTHLANGWELAKFVFSGAPASVESIVNIPFYSAMPTSFGPSMAAQFQWVPCKFTPVMPHLKDSVNMFRDQIKQTLRHGELCWQLQAWQYVDSHNTPIEEGMSEWSQTDKSNRHAGWVTLGHLTIPKQEVTISQDFCTNIAFNTWNTSPENKPIGPAARVRRGVYHDVQKHRIERQTGQPWVRDINQQDIEHAREKTVGGVPPQGQTHTKSHSYGRLHPHVNANAAAHVDETK